MKLYSIKDVKAGFMTIMLFKNDALAKRAYASGLKMPESMLSHNPEDFELWCLGEYDQDSGIITSDVRFVCNANSVGE